MIIFLENDQQIRGDLLTSARLRNDASPIPMTLELTVKAGEASFDKFFQQGKILKIASGEKFFIVKSERVSDNHAQGTRERTLFRITAILNPCLKIAFVRKTAVIKENTQLSAIYRACGASIKAIDADFNVARFSCFIGDTPSFHIAKALQEEGGIVRWKNGKLQFLRLLDLKKQKIAREFADVAPVDVSAGFLERFQVPSFYSIDASASFVKGNTNKERRVGFAPHQDVLRLFNMTRCLVQKKTVKVMFDQRIAAGDLIAMPDKKKYTVITAAHVFEKGNDDSGGEEKTYSKLWLGEVEE